MTVITVLLVILCLLNAVGFYLLLRALRSATISLENLNILLTRINASAFGRQGPLL